MHLPHLMHHPLDQPPATLIQAQLHQCHALKIYCLAVPHKSPLFHAKLQDPPTQRQPQLIMLQPDQAILPLQPPQVILHQDQLKATHLPPPQAMLLQPHQATARTRCSITKSDPHCQLSLKAHSMPKKTIRRPGKSKSNSHLMNSSKHFVND